ncbi:MAG: helix-turn-helix domain-containing protein [Ignavibacteriales bacterium]
MNFCENLQMLRKEHNLSQEQLAEKLDVSRQAVSKWESGQSYPEMDKIITMCKIFNCSMDALVNESITDIKETEKRAKNSIISYIEEFLEFISRTVKMLTSMKFGELIKCAMELFIIGMVILIFKVPVEYIGSLGSRLFSILPNFISYFVIQVWYFILNLSYFILAIIVFVHIFKTRYLDYFEETNTESLGEEPAEINHGKKGSEEKHEPIKKERVFRERRDNLHSFVNILSKLMTLFIKSLIIAISLPFLVSLLMFAIFLVISIGLLFQGVVYFGITIAIISALVFNIFLIETLYNLIFNKKNNLNKIFIVLLSTIIGLGIGIGITTFDVANSKFINEIPDNIKQTSKVETYDMSNDLMVDDWHSINYITDESLTDKVKLEVSYYPDHSFPTMEVYNNQLQIYSRDTEQIIFSKLYKLVVNDLKKKQIHNYSLLYDIKVTVYSSKANIDKLKANTKAYYHSIAEEQNNYQNMVNQYEQTIRYYQDEMAELESKNETQKSEYELEVQQYQNKIQEYKDKINNLITE